MFFCHLKRKNHLEISFTLRRKTTKHIKPESRTMRGQLQTFRSRETFFVLATNTIEKFYNNKSDFPSVEFSTKLFLPLVLSGSVTNTTVTGNYVLGTVLKKADHFTFQVFKALGSGQHSKTHASSRTTSQQNHWCPSSN